MVGIHLVVATFVGLAIGHYLDKALGTKPWLTFIFLFLGIFTGFRDMFRIVKRDLMTDESGDGGDDPPAPGYDDEDGPEREERDSDL